MLRDDVRIFVLLYEPPTASHHARRRQAPAKWPLIGKGSACVCALRTSDASGTEDVKAGASGGANRGLRLQDKRQGSLMWHAMSPPLTVSLFQDYQVRAMRSVMMLLLNDEIDHITHDNPNHDRTTTCRFAPGDPDDERPPSS
jgi:hypothetical protein